MMKKLTLILLVALSLVPFSAFAQDQEPLWDLSQVVDVEDLGVRANVPDGWTVVESGVGIALVENESDVEAVADSDPDTNPEGYALAISGLPLAQLGVEDLSLEEIGDLIAQQAQIEVSESDELTVNLRPAHYIAGISAQDGKGGYIAFWMQGEYLITAILALPDDDLNTDNAFSFGVILGTVRPIVPEDVSSAEEPLEVTDLGFTMIYPDGWTTADALEIAGVPGAVFAELEDDITAETPEGTVIGLIQLPGSLEGLELTEDSEAADWVEALSTQLGIEDAESQGEFIVNGAWGVGFTGTSGSTGRPGFAIVTYSDDPETFTIYTLATPDEDTLEYYTPVFLAMLTSITAVE